MTDLLNRLYERLPELQELAGSLAHARKRLALERQDPEVVALATIRTTWHTASQKAAPAFLVADLLAECWTVLVEEALAQGAPDRCRLALQLAEAAFAEGSGDPYLVSRLQLSWALYHRAMGESDSVCRRLLHLRRAAEAIQDPRLLAEAELWVHLFALEKRRDLDAEAAFRRAREILGKEESSVLLAQVVARLNRLTAKPPPPPSPQPVPAPRPDDPSQAEPDPALEDTREEPLPGAATNR